MATSRPALVKMPSTKARLSSRLVRVVARAPSRAAPPKTVPSRKESDVDWAISEIKDATGRGSRVDPVGGTFTFSLNSDFVMTRIIHVDILFMCEE